MRVEKICFFIAPVGETDSKIRKRSDMVFNYVIKPVAMECGYEPIRADHISEPGMIQEQIIEHIVKDPLVIADLTGHNGDIFYELAVRHITRKPTVQMMQRGEQIPFGVASIRTVEIDINDVGSVEEGKNKIIKQIRSIEGGKTELNTPISAALSIQLLSQSKNSEQRLVADLVKGSIPPIFFDITQNLPNGQKRHLPDVGLNIDHLGDSLPVKFSVAVRVFLGDKDLGIVKTSQYTGERLWNLNPRFGVRGHFSVPDEVVESKERLELRVKLTVIDQQEREHQLLPLGWVYMRDRNSWYLEPCGNET